MDGYVEPAKQIIGTLMTLKSTILKLLFLLEVQPIVGSVQGSLIKDMRNGNFGKTPSSMLFVRTEYNVRHKQSSMNIDQEAS